MKFRAMPLVVVSLFVATATNIVILDSHQEHSNQAAPTSSPISRNFLTDNDENLHRIAILESQLSKEREHRKVLEAQLASVVAATSALTSANSTRYTSDSDRATMDSLQQSSNPKNFQQAMIAAGMSEESTEQIRQLVGKNRMQLLSLRDQAVRENWIDTPKYAEKIKSLTETREQIRDQLGDDVYDRYLYASGNDNRIQVVSIYPDSPAEQLGLKEGDIILSYDGKKMFSMRELRTATASGQSEKAVLLAYLRNGQTQYVTLSRGPIGIEMSMIRFLNQNQ